jgi:hypothetical protein
MGIGIRHMILFLVVVSSIFVYLPHAKGGCGGPCAVSGGGTSSSSFMGDPAVNVDMSSFDEFVRDNLGGDPRTALLAKSPLQDKLLTINSSLNQTRNDNPSQNSMGNTTSNNRTVKLGASGMQDERLSTLASSIFNSNMF